MMNLLWGEVFLTDKGSEAANIDCIVYTAEQASFSIDLPFSQGYTHVCLEN